MHYVYEFSKIRKNASMVASSIVVYRKARSGRGTDQVFFRTSTARLDSARRSDRLPGRLARARGSHILPEPLCPELIQALLYFVRQRIRNMENFFNGTIQLPNAQKARIATATL